MREFPLRKKNINLIRICANFLCNAPFDRYLTQCPYCGLKIEPPGSGGGGRISPQQVDGDLVMLDAETLRQLEGNTVLEDPIRLQERVTAVAGIPAGIRAMRNQQERLATQTDLANICALWAGHRRKEGLTDRQINKKFFIDYNTTIYEVLALPKAEMVEWIETLKGDL